MTKQHFHQLFNRVYLISTGLCLLFYIWSEYGLDRADAGPFAVLRYWRHLTESLLILFALPALIMAVVMTLVRLTNHVEPLTEEQRRVSFVERLSVIQLFLPLSLPLLIPVTLQIQASDMYTPAGLIYLFIVFHAVVTWLLVLWLRRIARVRKTGWKIVSILLFILTVAAYEIVPPTALYQWSKTETEYRISHGDFDNDERQPDDPDADLAQMPQEELASKIARRALDTYDYYEGDPVLLLDVAKEFFQYDPDRIYFGVGLSTSEMTQEELDRQSVERRKNFDRMQELGRYCKWACDNLDYDELQTLAELTKKALLYQSDRYDYSLFAKRIDMLDVAYRDLIEQGIKIYEEYKYAYFSDIYHYALETPLFWENYSQYISNPYIRYTVEESEEDQSLLLWAYTFWGRRYNEGNYAYCRLLIDKILEAYPNTLYPPEKLEKQNALMRDAEARVTEFFKWYKANYWSFRELKAARYDDKGSLVKLDREEYGKYLHALDACGYLSPRLLRRLEIPENSDADSVKTGNVRERHGEWLRIDPLIGNYNAIAGEIDALTSHTEQIWNPGQEMRIATSIEYLLVDVECIDSKWFICGIVHTEND